MQDSHVHEQASCGCDTKISEKNDFPENEIERIDIEENHSFIPSRVRSKNHLASVSNVSTDAPRKRIPKDLSDIGDDTIVRNLSSGHRVEISLDEQIIDVFNIEEKLQVSIRLTDKEPIVQLEGAKIQMKSTTDIDMTCENLHVNTNEDLYLNSKGAVTIDSQEELHINCEMDIRIQGKIIWLN
jgi:hypothetical protein